MIRVFLLFFKQLFCHYIPNFIINNIPFYVLRNLYYKNIMGIEIDKKSSIHMKVFIEGTYRGIKRLKIGKNVSIGRRTYLDSRGGLEIGDNVSISPEVKIITASHKVDCKDFTYLKMKVIIEEYVWIGTGAIILPGITLEKGSVIAAGSVVTKDVKAFTVIGGNPAKFIKNREKILQYEPIYLEWFD